MRYNRLYIVDNMMSKKFQYNFTAQNQLIELRDRINELQEENTLLKQSLEELIRVNTELTQSIQQFNTDNNQLQYQQHQIEEMTHTIEMLNNQIEEVKRENQILNGSPIQTKKFSSDEAETESLVLVLEQLIESFKNMQARYENQIQQFQQKFDSCKGQYQQMLLKMQQAYEQKLETLQPILTQLARKDENLLEIQRKIKDIQNNKDDKKSIYHMNTINKINPRKSRTYRDLQEKLQEKQNVISFLLETLNKLKVKFMQKL